MLKKLWHGLKKLWQRIWRPRSPQVQRSRQDDIPVMRDGSCEALFMKLLDGAAEGWSQEQLLAKAGDSIANPSFHAWLKRFGRALLGSTVPQPELVQRLIRLSEVGCGVLGEMAGEIGRELQERWAQPLTEGEYEQLLEYLLVRVQGWKTEDFERFWQSLGENGNPETWTAWLKEFVPQPESETEILRQAQNDTEILRQAQNDTEILRQAQNDMEDTVSPVMVSEATTSPVMLSEGTAERSISETAALPENPIDTPEQPDNHPQHPVFEITSREKLTQLIQLGEKLMEVPGWEEFGRVAKERGEGWLQGLQGDRDQEVEAWFDRGYEQYTAGDLLGALASFDQVVVIKPDFHNAWGFRGVVLVELGRLEEAVASFDQAVAIQPDYHEAWHDRGLVLSKLGRLEDALVSWEKGLEIKPDDHEAWHDRGNVLSDLGRLEEALASYDQVVVIKPDSHEAWYDRGVVLRELGRLEAALASYDQVVVIKPDSHEAWHNRGVVLSNLGRLEEALASWDQVVAIKPDHHGTWHNRGVALSELGRLEEALDSYDRALEIKPDYHEAWLMRGQTVLICDDKTARCLSFTAITQAHPELNKRGYQGAIITYQQALQYIHEDTHPEGLGLFHSNKSESLQSRPLSHLEPSVTDKKPKNRKRLSAIVCRIEILVAGFLDFIGELSSLKITSLTQ